MKPAMTKWCDYTWDERCEETATYTGITLDVEIYTCDKHRGLIDWNEEKLDHPGVPNS